MHARLQTAAPSFKRSSRRSVAAIAFAPAAMRPQRCSQTPVYDPSAEPSDPPGNPQECEAVALDDARSCDPMDRGYATQVDRETFVRDSDVVSQRIAFTSQDVHDPLFDTVHAWRRGTQRASTKLERFVTSRPACTLIRSKNVVRLRPFGATARHPSHSIMRDRACLAEAHGG